MTDSRKKRSIIFVDEDITTLQSAKALLGNDWDLMTAASAAEALSLVDEYSADMVIAATALQGGDGLPLLRGSET